MTDRIDKFLLKLESKERQRLINLIERIVHGEHRGLDVKKLHGTKDVYRVRMGSIRIIYRMIQNVIMIIAIERRSDTTYRS